MRENYLFQVLDNIPEPRLILDNEGTIIKSNKLALELLCRGNVGHKSNSLSDLPSLDSSPDWMSCCRTAIAKAASGETVIFQACLFPARLDHTDLEFLLIPIPALDKKQGRLLCTVRDVTEQNKMQRKMSKDRQLTTALLNAAPVFIVALDRQAKILLTNEPMLRALGYGRSDDLIGKDYISAVVPPEEREQVISILARGFNSDRSAENDIVSVRKVAGRLIEWHLSLVHGETDEDDFALVVGVDVTKRLEAEKLGRGAQATACKSHSVDILGNDYCRLSTRVKQFK